MRIVAGTLRGRRLASPGRNVRPTAERVREAVMSILMAHLDGARVLDAYAGTGAYGFEALSRGAASVVFVEADVRTARQLEVAARELEMHARTTVIRGTAPAALSRATGPFELVFCDPPYEQAAPDALLVAIGPLVAPHGRLVLETSAQTAPPPSGGGLALEMTRTYGETRITVYARAAQSDGTEGHDLAESLPRPAPFGALASQKRG